MLSVGRKSGTCVWIALLASSFFFSGEAWAERGRFFVRRPISANRGITSRRISLDDVKNVPDATNLVQFGGSLLERNRRGELRRIFIDPFSGRLVGATEQKTVNELVEVLSKNPDALGRGNRRAVDRFLARNGNAGAFTGQFTIDLCSALPETFDHNRDPEGYAKNRQLQVALATLNSFLNHVSRRSTILRVSPRNIRGDCSVTLNLGRFFDRDQLALLAQADRTSQCTGKIRLQSLLAFGMQVDNYYSLIDAPKTRRDLERQVGVNADKKDTLGNAIYIRKPNGENDSGVTQVPGRIASWLNQRRLRGATCYKSDDSSRGKLAPGGQADARDLFKAGIFYQHDAEEWLCHAPNGFLRGYLFDGQNGNRINEAPASVAQGGRLGGAVYAGVGCIDCHAKGILGGGIKRIGSEAGQPYTDNFHRIPRDPTPFRDEFGRQATLQDFFTKNSVYRQRADRDQAIMFNAMARAGAVVPDEKGFPRPLVPDFLARYQANLTTGDMARELRVSENAVKAAFPGISQTVDRNTFEGAFCGLKNRLGGALASRGAQDNILGGRGSSSFGFRGGSGPHNSTLGSGSRPRL